jgi:hypothetical protein
MRNRYEKVDGGSNNSPEVLVTDYVVRQLGMPDVDFDQLHELTTKCGEPYDQPPQIRLHGRGLMPKRFRTPLTRAVVVNAVAGETRIADYASKGGTVYMLARELTRATMTVPDALRYEGAILFPRTIRARVYHGYPDAETRRAMMDVFVQNELFAHPFG